MYDILVIGAGHAGIEASLACARLNKKTALITTHLDSIAHLPCNPSIGGPAKGVVVREIDALGGQMGITIDHTYIQMKMLNTNKGPAVQSLRAQVDKAKYPEYMKNTVLKQPNLTVIENSVSELIIDDMTIKGVTTKDGVNIYAQKVIITAGTYLESACLVGSTTINEGPDGYDSIKGFTKGLEKIGFKFKRLKTGTPARVAIDSVDYTKTTPEYGSDEKIGFSELTTKYLPLSEQVACYLTYTTLDTHDIINSNLDKSSMYSGVAKGVGARYCPSVEDKIVRFSDKDRHQIFLEPESKHMNTIYVQGFSTSMPHDIQEKMIYSIPGLEKAKILKYGYAIEYEAFDSTQLYPSLESMIVSGLYTAGQINGTSGYEEAAAQGLIAGINASLSIEDKKPLVLRRDQAYIGVMIDDLVTKGTNEPYRLLTSRAEYRLLLRHDNAAQRLTKISYDIGLASQARFEILKQDNESLDRLFIQLSELRFTPKHQINDFLDELGSSRLYEGVSAIKLLKRPEVKIEHVLKYLDDADEYSQKVKNQLEIQVKYEGYITKATKQALKFQELENKLIPEDIDYSLIGNLATEAKQKLTSIRPSSIGQATRISGINPSDIQNLLIHMKSR